MCNFYVSALVGVLIEYMDAFSKMSGVAMVPNQPLVQWEQQFFSSCKANTPPPGSSKVKNKWRYGAISMSPVYDFMVLTGTNLRIWKHKQLAAVRVLGSWKYLPL